MSKKLGALIKEARTNAGYTQEQLARKVDGLSASEISKAERGELKPTQAQLKEIAKATGVTQSSLLNAAKSSSASTKKSTTTKKTSSSSKKSSSGKTSMKVSSTEKKLVELYREADSETKKAAMSLLKGETTSTQDILSGLLENAMEMLTK